MVSKNRFTTAQINSYILRPTFPFINEKEQITNMLGYLLPFSLAFKALFFIF